MTRLIPTILRGPDVSGDDLAKQMLDAQRAIRNLNAHLPEATSRSVKGNAVSSNLITLWECKGRKVFGGIISPDNDEMIIVPSAEFKGHVFLPVAKDGLSRLGTCDEVFTALQDSMVTEAFYADRVRTNVLHRRRGNVYTPLQKEAARSFARAASTAKSEWNHALNGFVFVCNQLNIDLPSGYQPQDRIPPELRYK